MAQVERATSTGGKVYLTSNVIANGESYIDLGTNCTIGNNLVIGQVLDMPTYAPRTITDRTEAMLQGLYGIRFGNTELPVNAYIMCVDNQEILSGTVGVKENEFMALSVYGKDDVHIISNTVVINAGAGILIQGKDSVSLRSTDGYIYSDTIKDTTTASAANVYIDTSDSVLKRSTSAKKYKENIEDITLDYANNFFYNAKPIFYKSKCKMDGGKTYYGYVADDVAKVEPRLVQYGKDNEPEGFSYDRVPALLHTKMLEQDKRIKELEEKIEKLTKKGV